MTSITEEAKRRERKSSRTVLVVIALTLATIGAIYVIDKLWIPGFADWARCTVTATIKDPPCRFP
jgi:hypothetical protein